MKQSPPGVPGCQGHLQPSIILSSLMGWNIFYTNMLMGGLLIIYTASGGARAVAYTQQLQMAI